RERSWPNAPRATPNAPESAVFAGMRVAIAPREGVEMKRKQSLSALAVISLSLIAPDVHAAVESYVATLDGVQEVPPNGTQGSGQATLTFDTASSRLSGTIAVSKLQGTSVVIVDVEDAACGAAPALPPMLTLDPPNDQGITTVSVSLDAAQIAAL